MYATQEKRGRKKRQADLHKKAARQAWKARQKINEKLGDDRHDNVNANNL